jgi:hypothetical protein
MRRFFDFHKGVAIFKDPNVSGGFGNDDRNGFGDRGDPGSGNMA